MVPDHIWQALDLENEIMGKSGATTLQDNELDVLSGDEDGEQEDGEEDIEGDIAKEGEDDEVMLMRAPIQFVTKHDKHDGLSTGKGLAQRQLTTKALSAKIAESLDPVTQAARDDARALQRYQGREISALRLQVRDHDLEIRDL